MLTCNSSRFEAILLFLFTFALLDFLDDDESGSTGYHSALPLEVHGTGYVQMQMISNSKAEKLASF